MDYKNIDTLDTIVTYQFLNEMGFSSLPTFWNLYGYFIEIVALICVIFIIYRFLAIKTKLDSDIIVLLFSIPLSFYIIEGFERRNPTSFQEIFKNQQQYNLEYARLVVLPNKEVYFLPAYTKELSKSIQIPLDSIKRIYYNETQIDEPLNKTPFRQCSIYLFVDIGKGDLSNNQYISLPYKSANLYSSCYQTAQIMSDQLNNALKILKFKEDFKIEALHTDATIASYTYPKAHDEFNAGIIINEKDTKDTIQSVFDNKNDVSGAKTEDMTEQEHSDHDHPH